MVKFCDLRTFHVPLLVRAVVILQSLNYNLNNDEDMTISKVAEIYLVSL